MTTVNRAIETEYLGYRFRSRLEARWAVFLTALGVPFEYEPEGFQLGDMRYLPDFYLPREKLWIEVKPTLPEAATPEAQKAIALARHSGEMVLIVAGDPSQGTVAECHPEHSWRKLNETSLSLCLFCGCLGPSVNGAGCTHEAGHRFYGSESSWRLHSAKQLARSARFEHGEKPDTVIPPVPGSPYMEDVYLAGKVPSYVCCRLPPRPNPHDEPDAYDAWQESANRGCACEAPELCSSFDWRSKLFPEQFKSPDSEHPFEGRTAKDGYWYAGPQLRGDHNMYEHAISTQCLKEVKESDFLFAWVHRGDIHGTLVEIGYAKALGIKVFLGFDSRDRELEQELWFVKHIADFNWTVPGVEYAWALFTQTRAAMKRGPL